MFKYARWIPCRFYQGSLPPSPHRIPSPFNFDTYKLVRQLERQGLTRGQAVAVMRTMNAFLVDQSTSCRAELLSNATLENLNFQYKNRLQELRNELSLLRQNESASLKADAESLMREIDSVNSKFSELLASLKADISMDVNNHKADGRELGTETDLRIQEVMNQLTVKTSGIKTKIESLKVELTRTIVCRTHVRHTIAR